jgi:hypothetical protein
LAPLNFTFPPFETGRRDEGSTGTRSRIYHGIGVDPEASMFIIKGVFMIREFLFIKNEDSHVGDFQGKN